MIEINNILEVESLIDDIDFVVFDLDDTLYSEKEYVLSGFSKIAEEFGIPKLASELWVAFTQGEKAIDVVFENEGMVDRKTEAINIYRNQMPEIHLYDGVWDMLNRFKRSGRIIGLLTDGRPEGQHAKIEALKLKGLFDEIVVTDELGGIGCRKPNKIGFEMLHTRAGIPYEKMAYIGDNLNKDFVAPEKLGMKCIHFSNKDGLYR